MADRDQMEHEVPSTHINDLPNEMLLKIFSFLPVDDLALNIQLVCVRWSYLCLADVLWEGNWFRVKTDELGSVSGFSYRKVQSVPDILRVLENTPKLQCIELDTTSPAVFHKVADCCKNLRKLKCECMSRIEDVRYLLSQCRTLEHLTLSENTVCDRNITENDVKLIRLRAMRVGKWFFPRTVRLIKLKHISDSCPCLQHLEISTVKWHYSDVEYFLERKSKTLVSFGISWESVEGLDVFPLLEIYGRGLRKLILHSVLESDRRIDGPSFSVIKTLSNLTTLRIRCADEVAEGDMAQIFMGGAMSQLLELEIVSSSGTTVNEAFVNIICNNCPDLLSLVLVNIFLNDDGLKYLYNCSNLEHLDLSKLFYPLPFGPGKSVLTDAAMDHIARCPKLKHLNLVGARLTEQCFGRLLELSELRDLELTLCDGAELPSDLVALHLRKLIQLTVKYYDKINNKEIVQIVNKSYDSLLRAAHTLKGDS